MQMMYTIVADAIKEHGVEAKPTDYLMFFCLAKREGMNDIPEDIGPPAAGTKAELVSLARECVRSCDLRAHARTLFCLCARC